jgi:hypothetical protein
MFPVRYGLAVDIRVGTKSRKACEFRTRVPPACIAVATLGEQ